MEALRSHRLGATSRKRHDRQRSHEHRERESQTKHLERSLQAVGHRDEFSKPSLAALGRGPTPRPKEQNDEFVQAWLQQTQARHSHLPKPGHETREPRLAERSRAAAHRDGQRKRPRPSFLSDPSPPSPEPAKQAEYQFEKRVRHKTRDDKYDYKPRLDKKHKSDHGVRESRTTGTTEDRARRAEGRHLVGKLNGKSAHMMLISRSQPRQGKAEPVAGHMIRRESKPMPKAGRISKSLTRRASEPKASKSKLSKSQKEDKELEEFSAFFSQGRPYRRETREYGLEDGESPIYGQPLDADLRTLSSGHAGRGSFHGSKPSYRSVTVSEREAVPRYSSSLPAIRSKDSEVGRPSRPSHKPNCGSVWSRQYDERLIEDQPRPHYRRRCPSPLANNEHRTRREPDPVVSTESRTRSPEQTRGGTRGARKDAAAQTDLTLRPKDGAEKHRGHLNEGWVVKDNPVVEGHRRYSPVAPDTSFDRVTYSLPRDVMDKAVESQLLSVPRPVQDAICAEPHFGSQQLQGGSQHQGFGNFSAVAGAKSQQGGFDHVDQSMYTSVPNRAVDFGHSGEGGEGSLLDLYTRPAKQTVCADRYFTGDRGDRDLKRFDDPRGVPGNFGFENLEEFIRRIEGEAAMPPKQGEDNWVVPSGEVGVSDWYEPRSPPGLSGVVKLDQADDAAIISGRSRSQLETDLFLSLPAGQSVLFPGRAGFDCPASLLTPGPYRLGKQEGGGTELWQHRDMF